MVNEIEVMIDRDSVCMGDDVDDHRIFYTIDKASTFSSLFKTLIDRNYFPHVAGNDVVWTLVVNDEDIASFKTAEGKIYTRFIDKEPNILAVKRWQAIDHIRFHYYSSPLKRAKAIFMKFGRDKFHLWHEGFFKEYASYKVTEEMEEEWLETLDL